MRAHTRTCTHANTSFQWPFLHIIPGNPVAPLIFFSIFSYTVHPPKAGQIFHFILDNPTSYSSYVPSTLFQQPPTLQSDTLPFGSHSGCKIVKPSLHFCCMQRACVSKNLAPKPPAVETEMRFIEMIMTIINYIAYHLTAKFWTSPFLSSSNFSSILTT